MCISHVQEPSLSGGVAAEDLDAQCSAASPIPFAICFPELNSFSDCNFDLAVIPTTKLSPPPTSALVASGITTFMTEFTFLAATSSMTLEMLEMSHCSGEMKFSIANIQFRFSPCSFILTPVFRATVTTITASAGTTIAECRTFDGPSQRNKATLTSSTSADHETATVAAYPALMPAPYSYTAGAAATPPPSLGLVKLEQKCGDQYMSSEGTPQSFSYLFSQSPESSTASARITAQVNSSLEQDNYYYEEYEYRVSILNIRICYNICRGYVYM